MANLKFNTHVSGQHEGVHFIRNKPMSELVEQSSFAHALYYMIMAQEPTPVQERVLNAILVASMDHGISPASGFVPRVVTSTGNDIVHAMAGGLLALGPYHGSAISGAAEVLAQVREQGVESLQHTHFDRKKRVLGLGHPHYKHTDPRADQLFAIANHQGLDATHQELMYSVQEFVYRTLNKHLVINIDGAIAALLLDLGFPPQAGNGLFALSRAGGMIAHILEEQQEKPIRRVDESDVHFTPPNMTQSTGEQE